MVNYSLLDQVKELALSLPDGCTDSHCECPKCGKAGSFNITRADGQLKFICFRASCGFKGRIDGKSGRMAQRDSLVIQKKLFDGALEALHQDEIDYLSDKFNINPKWLQYVRWGVDDSRVYFPQYAVTGKVQGYIARAYPDLTIRPPSGAKALWKPVLANEPGLCFPCMEVLAMVREQKQVVLVEDYPSALRITSQLGVPCCCLGGTNLYDSVVSSLIALDVERVVVVLDSDAVVKAVKMRRLLSLVFPNTIVIPLTGPDPKDMSVQELEKLGYEMRMS